MHKVVDDDGEPVVFKRQCDAVDAALGFSKRIRLVVEEKPIDAAEFMRELLS